VSPFEAVAIQGRIALAKAATSKLLAGIETGVAAGRGTQAFKSALRRHGADILKSGPGSARGRYGLPQRNSGPSSDAFGPTSKGCANDCGPPLVPGAPRVEVQRERLATLRADVERIVGARP
jgi:hypothetical protein